MRHLLAWWLALWCLPAFATEAPVPVCAPHVVSTMAATAPENSDIRPAAGWEPVTLPDTWRQRWQGYSGSVWYRIDWTRECDTTKDAPIALSVEGISMAGKVYVNDVLLWRDESLTEPLSMSWNTPRWWILPESALHEGVNTIWIKVIGLSEFTPGLGRVQIGPAAEVRQTHAGNMWSHRTVYYITLGMSAAVGGIFLVVWIMMRSERAFGWYAMMALCWVLYLSTMLATDPWPLASVLMHSRINNIAFVLYVLSFCLFTWRFGEQQLRRTERMLWLSTGIGIVLSLFASRQVAELVWLVFVLIFMANCLQFQWHAWRTRKPQHMLLALCWLVFLVVSAHDLLAVLKGWHSHAMWGSIGGPVIVVFMSLLLGGRLASSMRRIARFNLELQDHVAQVRHELTDVLVREHEQALSHATLQQRMQIIHDLHDGLGGSLVRSMALVEQTREPLSNQRMLSLLKILRDDLRQVIDQGASDGVNVPETPAQWIAPLRHRFTHLLDEMGITPRWQMPDGWHYRPSPLQCLGLARLIEEALSNVVKHSRAHQVVVSCRQARVDVLEVSVEDDGVGFDVDAVRSAGLSVGIRSMTARAERMGGTLQISSNANGTVLRVVIPLTGDYHSTMLQPARIS